MRSFLKERTVKNVHLWNAPDHGYLTVYSAYRLLKNGVVPGKGFAAGRLEILPPLKIDLLQMSQVLQNLTHERCPGEVLTLRGGLDRRK